MASLAIKVPENVAGVFYVDNTCIDCDLCRQTASNFFRRKFLGNTGYTYVYRQPSNPDEEELCMDALRACPVEAIGVS